MHPGLQSLAEEQSVGRLSSLIAKVKSLASNRDAIRQATGKQLILARSFFSPSTFSKPESRDAWLGRVRGNFGHYRSLCAPLATSSSQPDPFSFSLAGRISRGHSHDGEHCRRTASLSLGHSRDHCRHLAFGQMASSSWRSAFTRCSRRRCCSSVSLSSLVPGPMLSSSPRPRRRSRLRASSCGDARSSLRSRHSQYSSSRSAASSTLSYGAYCSPSYSRCLTLPSTR